MFISSMYNGSLKNNVLTCTWASNTQPVCSCHMALSRVLFKSQIVAAWLSAENSFNLKRLNIMGLKDKKNYAILRW
jgi:hypothetical protein